MSQDDGGFAGFDWDEIPSGLWNDVTDGRGWGDEYGQFLFDMVFVDPQVGEVRDVAYEALVEWFHDEYGVDFADVFDWDAWREWYE